MGFAGENPKVGFNGAWMPFVKNTPFFASSHSEPKHGAELSEIERPPLQKTRDPVLDWYGPEGNYAHFDQL